MSKSMVVYIVLLTILIGLVYYGSSVWEEVESERDQKQNVTVVSGIRGADIKPSKPLEISQFKAVTATELSEAEKNWATSIQSPGAYRMGDLVLVNPLDKEKSYTFVRQMQTDFEIQLIVKVDEKEKEEGEPLIGRMNMSDLFPIGVYTETGEFLQ